MIECERLGLHVNQALGSLIVQLVNGNWLSYLELFYCALPKKEVMPKVIRKF